MNQLPPEVQQRLVDGYRTQLRLYDEAVALASQAGAQDWAYQLNGKLRAIAELDAASADDRTLYRQVGPQPGELSALLEQVANRLDTLRQTIDREVQQLQERRDKMLPEIDEFIQRRRMFDAYSKAAYGKIGDRHPHVA